MKPGAQEGIEATQHVSHQNDQQSGKSEGMTTEEEVGQSLNLNPRDGEEQKESSKDSVDRLKEEHKPTRVREDLCS